MKNIFGKVLGIVLGMLCFCIPLWGCAMLETSDKKVSEIDFTVVSPEELPEEALPEDRQPGQGGRPGGFRSAQPAEPETFEDRLKHFMQASDSKLSEIDRKSVV